MGNAMCCGMDGGEATRRQELLKQGSDFKKKNMYLGMISTTEAIYLRVNATATKLQWRLAPASDKIEEIPLFRIGKLHASGAAEMLILGHKGEKLLELTAESPSVRDLWVQTLEELCQADPERQHTSKELEEEIAKQTEKERENYWSERTLELAQRRKDAEERKKKLGVFGMKYTAEAMARR